MNAVLWWRAFRAMAAVTLIEARRARLVALVLVAALALVAATPLLHAVDGAERL